MLYILLIIIAVGVLLASKAGQKLLKVLLIITAVAGVGYLGFWAVILGIGLLSNESNINDILSIIFYIIGYFLIIVFGGWVVNVFYKTKEKRDETITMFKNKLKYQWREKKIKFIFIVALILISIFCWIFVPIII